MSTTDPTSIRSKIARHEHWYHQIELAPGIVTPGTHPSRLGLEQLDDLGLPRDASGMRVLDIGCRDGFFAFAMEGRGAEVVGIDYADPEVTGFAIASEILGSRVDYRVENVYDLDPEELGTFDIVLFLGVLYHLRNPMLAVDRIRAVTRDGGSIYVESQLATDRRVAKSEIPLWQFFPRDSLAGDATNKWAPNLVGLAAAIEESRFECIARKAYGERGYVVGRAIRDEEMEFFQELDSSKGVWGRQGV